MKVNELIELLSEYDPETNVAVASDEEWNVVRHVSAVDPDVFYSYSNTNELEDADPDDEGTEDFLVIW